MTPLTMTPEREAELREYGNWAAVNTRDASDLLRELDATRARVTALEAALRPFALLATDNPQCPPGVPIRLWDETEPDRPAVEPTMADCRRAAALLAEPGEGR